MHKLTIAGLNDFEASHIAEILRDYKTKIMTEKLYAIVEDHKDNGSRTEWFEKHLEWHEGIMKKIVWAKE